jgi:hypothetical protein
MAKGCKDAETKVGLFSFIGKKKKKIEKRWQGFQTTTPIFAKTYLRHEAETNCHTEGIKATNTCEYTNCR